MRHHLSQLPLTHGWLPAVAQLIAVMLLAAAVGWRSRRWRQVWLPMMLAGGAALALCASWYIGSLGLAGDPAPPAVWIWIAATGVAVSVLMLGWRGTRWWRRGVSVLAVPLCALSAGLAVNGWVGYFPTVHTAWNQLTAGPLPDQTDRVGVTAMQLEGIRPAKGVVVPVTIPAEASKFNHRRELVYLPPGWFADNPAPRLPAVMMIGAALNTPADWLRAGNALETVDDFASGHGGNAPVLVFVDATGAFNNDTECVNGSRGNAADHLTKDVVPYLVSNFRVRADKSGWGVLGWSMGGTCAVVLTTTHPDMFSAFVDIAGDVAPNAGTKTQTIAALFGGKPDAYAAFDPTSVIVSHGRYSGVAGWFDVPGGPANRGPMGGGRDGPVGGGRDRPVGSGRDPGANPEGQDVAATTLCELARAHGIRCAVVAQPGRHDWPFAAQAFATTLPWLAGRLGTPGVARQTLPGLAPDSAPAAEAAAAPTAQKAGR